MNDNIQIKIKSLKIRFFMQGIIEMDHIHGTSPEEEILRRGETFSYWH